MRNWMVLLLVIMLTAGCASASVFSYLPLENQEERVQKLLVGTWDGYVKDSRWYFFPHRDRILQIYHILKEQNGWVVNASLNYQPLVYIKLYFQYNGELTLEMLDPYDGLYILTLYRDTHLLGVVGYGEWKRIDPHEVVFEKILR